MPQQADLFVPLSDAVVAPAAPLVAPKPVSWELRQGTWQEALADVECDALIVDAPYSERTHSGHNKSTKVADGGAALSYEHWTPEDVQAFVAAWSERTRGWLVSLTDSELYPAWRDALRASGRYVFAPLPCVQVGMTVRQAGDGPANWTCWAVVARPRSFGNWGSLRGDYRGSSFDVDPNGSVSRSRGVTGGKPLWLMRALIRDYTRPGDLVCDPCAGRGTALRAAVIEGRNAIGAEGSAETYERARKWLSRRYTPNMFEREP